MISLFFHRTHEWMLVFTRKIHHLRDLCLCDFMAIDTDDGQTKTITVDEDYIRESIAYPAKKIVARGKYKNGGMGAFEINDERLSCLIDFMKSLAEEN